MLESVYKQLAEIIKLTIAVLTSSLKILVRSKFGLKFPPAASPVCCILGNGPSLKISLEKDLDFIKKHETFCVNNFIQSEYFEVLKPENYVLLDGYYFIFNDTTHNRGDIRATFEKFKTISWEIRLFVPYTGRNSYFIKALLAENKHIRVCYFNYVIAKGFKWFRHFVFMNNLGMLQCENVLASCLYIAINRGFKKIFMFGADHSWHEQFVLEDNRIMVSDVHFYDKKPVVPFVVHDRIKDKKVTIADYFLSFHKAFKSYQVIKEYAETQGSEILNASAKSYIDSFERVEVTQTEE